MSHNHIHKPERYILAIPLEKFPDRFGTIHHPTPASIVISPWFTCSVDTARAVRTVVDDFCADLRPFAVGIGEHGIEYGTEFVHAIHLGIMAMVGDKLQTIAHNDTDIEAMGKLPKDMNGMSTLSTARSILMVAKYTKDMHRFNDNQHYQGWGALFGFPKEIPIPVIG